MRRRIRFNDADFAEGWAPKAQSQLKHWLSLGSLFGLLVVLSALPAAAANALTVLPGQEIRDIRLGRHSDRIRLVFDLSGPVDSELLVLQDPARLQITLTDTTGQVDVRRIATDGTPINRIEVETRPDGKLVYEVLLRESSSYDFFPLKASHGRGDRLVLDLFTGAEAVASGKGVLVAVSPGANRAPLGTAVGAPGQSGAREKVTAAPYNENDENSGKWSGYLSLDSRLFFQEPKFSEQDDQNVSAALKPEYYRDWSDGDQRLAFSPFFRYDANDQERSHADIRELYWRIMQDRWLFKVGLDVVFWGVAESQHLVNIINQTDLVDNLDGEEKLGQPMVNVDYMSEWGTWQVFYLPYFRERTFPGPRGRLRNDPAVNANQPLYESDDKEKHPDFAFRWSKYVGDWDIGLAHFSGTSRQAVLLTENSIKKQRLTPFYPQIDQTSLDAQATKGAWLWKLEAIYNQNNFNDYYAYVSGFEYTSFGVSGSDADLGWLLEYHYDNLEIAADAELTSSAFQNDLFLGLRLTGNDIQSTSVLAGLMVDLDNQSTFYNLEFERRLGALWTLGVDARLFWNIDSSDIFYPVEQDDHIEIRLIRHF